MSASNDTLSNSPASSVDTASGSQPQQGVDAPAAGQGGSGGGQAVDGPGAISPPLLLGPVSIRTWLALMLVALVVALAAAALAWNTQQRVKALEAELVKRQQDSAELSTEARTLARQAEVSAREVTAKMALLEARVAETSLQRSQLEDLIQSLARTRDENVLADLDATIRVAQQQSTLTGSAEPLVLSLKQADERLARYNQPRLESVRRAVAQDLDRVRNAAVPDLTVLTMRLDEVMRQIDDLPLLAAGERPRAADQTGARPSGSRDSRPLARASAAPGGASGVSSGTVTEPNAGPNAGPNAEGLWGSTRDWLAQLGERWQFVLREVWGEVRSLVRVSRIETPEALLVMPEQAYFLRENIKLRLLNARLALLSRQFDTAQYDLRDAQSALDRYFDRSVRRVAAASELLRQTTVQARQVSVPRPDATLAAIATAAAGR